MSQYNKILEQFKTLGFSQTSTLQQFQLSKALDRINGGQEFDRDVAQQLWEHTTKNQSNTVVLREYIQSIIQAQNVLKAHIDTTQQKLKSPSLNPYDQQELSADLVSYVNDHNILTKPFKQAPIPQTQVIAQSRLTMQKSVAGAPFGTWSRTSQIFATAPSQSETSWSLKIVLLITVILLVLEILVMFHKHHFFNIMAYILIVLIFVQNYFSKVYMRITIVWLLLSVLFDFLWLIIHAENWWNPYAQTQHSTIQTGFLRFSYFMVICTMIAKVLVFILLLRYFNNEQNIKKQVHFFFLKFTLNGKNSNNPFTKALSSNKASSEPLYDYQ